MEEIEVKKNTKKKIITDKSPPPNQEDRTKAVKILEEVFSEGNSESIIKALETMYEPENIEMKTDLSEIKIGLITLARLLNDTFIEEFDINQEDIPIRNMIHDYMVLLVSKKRLGRTEWFSAIKAELERKAKSLTDRLLGRD